jgi:ATP-dependent Clp protease ATP-binding subunit ClpC
VAGVVGLRPGVRRPPAARTIAREVYRRLSHALLSNELSSGQHVVVGIEVDVPVLTITERG